MATRKDLSGDVQAILKEFDSVRKYWDNYNTRGVRAIKFVSGDQWEDEDRAQMQKAKRPMVTINVLGSMVRQVTGFRTKERVQPKVSPEREGTVNNANILTKLLYFILKKNNYKALNHDVQQDQVITGRGWYELFKDVDENRQGELKLRSADWNEIYPDFNAQDIFYRDARFMYRVKYLAKETIQSIYDVKDTLIHDAPEVINFTDDDDNATRLRDEFIDAAGNYLVIEKWEKKKDKKTLVTDGADFREVDGEINDDVFAQLGNGFAKTVTNRRKIMVTTVIPSIQNDKPIQRKEDKIGIGEYPFVPTLCYKTGNKVYGIIDDLIDEQKRTNKSFAQIIEILGYSTKGVYFVKEGSVDEDQMEKNVTRPGGIVNFTGDTPPQYQQTASFPTGYGEIFKASERNLSRISGIVPALEGRAEFSGESGTKFAQKVEQAREQLAVIDRRYLDAFNYLCKLILRAIPKTYNFEYSFQVLEGDDQVQDIKINEQTLRGIVNNITDDTAVYDVNVEMIPEQATIRQAELAELTKMMAQVGPQFAALFASQWIRGTDIPEKDAMAERLELLSGQTLQSEQMKLQLQALQQAQQNQAGEKKAQQDEQKQNAELALKAKKTQAEIQKLQSDSQSMDAKIDVDNLYKITDMTRGLNQGGGI